MKINEEKIDQVSVLTIHGRVEMIHTRELKEGIFSRINSNYLALVLDLSEMEYINSAGLGIFILAAKSMQEKKKRLVFCSLKENIWEICKIAGFIQILEIYDSREEAMAALKKEPVPTMECK